MTQVSELLDVSRETLERLRCFEALVAKWSPRINLVSRGSLADMWSRHIVDSIQLFSASSDWGKWVDLGSGGGFPGVVVAILAAEQANDSSVVLIESDQRKCAFLRTALRETGVSGQVISGRIESTPPQDANVLSARALTDLSKLLAFSERHLARDGTAIFPKGVTWEKEVVEAQKEWRFDLETIKSVTEPAAVLLKIQGVSRV